MAITNTVTRLTAAAVAGVALTGSEQTIYTAPTGTLVTAVITVVTLTNTTGADRAVTAGVGSTGTVANLRLSGLVIPANNVLCLGVYWELLSAETFRAFCSLSGGVTIGMVGIT